MKNIVLFIALFVPMVLFGEDITSNSNLSITKTWTQETNGWTYPMAVYVPTGSAPQGGFPVCILLHGNGGNGDGMLNQWKNELTNHVLVAPSGYEKSWNISTEKSDAPDVAMVSELIFKLQSFSNVDSTKIRLLGMSNGAALTNRMFVENKNTGVDIMCAVVSQLSESQYRNNQFYLPSGETGGTDQYKGYDTPTVPLKGRRYLSVGNSNDPVIPYTGGTSVGVNFIDAQLSIFQIAKSQGYGGAQLASAGVLVAGTSYEYSYLSKQVVHVKGDASHGVNFDQKKYIKDYFNLSLNISLRTENLSESTSFYPNPTSGIFHLGTKVNSIEFYDSLGKIVLKASNCNQVDLSGLDTGMYFFKCTENVNKVTTGSINKI